MNDKQSEPHLLALPIEIREEIYRFLIRRVYVAVNTTFETRLCRPDTTGDPTRDIKPRTVPPGLVILRVSKKISEEALNLLFKESVFVFRLDFTSPLPCEELSQKTVALMKNVWFDISAKGQVPRPWHFAFFFGIGVPSKEELMSQRTVRLFTGTKHLRRSMRITFKDCETWKPYSMPYIFAKAMKELGGFQKLVVEFEFPLALDELDDRAFRYLESEFQRYKDRFLMRDFGPAYGAVRQHAVRGARKYICYLEFRPSQHTTQKLIAEARNTLEEAVRISAESAAEERFVASLQEIVEKVKHV